MSKSSVLNNLMTVKMTGQKVAHQVSQVSQKKGSTRQLFRFYFSLGSSASQLHSSTGRKPLKHQQGDEYSSYHNTDR